MPDPDPVYAPMATPEELRPDPEADAHASTIQREGFVVLEHVLSREEVAAMRAALALLVEHPRLLSIIDRVLEPHYLLSAFLAIHVHPGETAQGWHFDDGGCRAPLPRPMHGVSAIWALDDFTPRTVRRR